MKAKRSRRDFKLKKLAERKHTVQVLEIRPLPGKRGVRKENLVRFLMTS